MKSGSRRQGRVPAVGSEKRRSPECAATGEMRRQRPFAGSEPTGKVSPEPDFGRGEAKPPRYAIVGLGIHLQTGRVSGLRGATQVIGETRLAAASIVSPLVKAALPEGLYKSVDSSLRKSLPVGLYKAIRLLGKEIMLHRLHRAGVKRAKAYAEKRGLKLNIGCGPNRKEGWINIDLSPRG